MGDNSETNEEKEKEIIVNKIEESEITECDELLNYKIIIVGDSGVGKSSLLKRAVHHIFSDHYQATIGFEFLLLYYDVNGKKMKLQIWDTCGQEMYRSLIQGFYRNTTLTLLIYAVNDKNSFDNLSEWIKDIKNNTEIEMPIFLIGNKIDLNNELKIVDKNSAEAFVENNHLQYFSEASAKTGYKIDEIFIDIAKYIYQNIYLLGKKKLKKLTMGLDQKKDEQIDEKNTKCC